MSVHTNTTDLYSTRDRRVILTVLVVVIASFFLRLYGLGFPVVCLKETRPKRRRAALWLEWQLPLLYTAISVSLFFRLLGFTMHFQTTILLMSPYSVVGLRGYLFTWWHAIRAFILGTPRAPFAEWSRATGHDTYFELSQLRCR